MIPRDSGYTFHEAYIREGVMAKVAKWGNSLAIRIPAVVAEVLDIKEGDEFEVRAGKNSIELCKTPDAAELFKRLRKYRGRMPAGWEFDRYEVNER